MRLLCLFLLALPLILAQRVTLSLDGIWQIADSAAAEPRPAAFTHTVPVPGLVHSATPAFPDVDKFDSREFIDVSIREKKLPDTARIDTAGIPRQQRNYFWYRTTFKAPARRASAILRVNKAQWGTSVWLNGRAAGDHLGCFSSGYFDLTPAIQWSAENELVIRIGAHPAVLPVWAPAGTDQEKYQWTPGIYDSVSVAFAGNPLIESVQAAPRLAESAVLIETLVKNASRQPVIVRLTHAVHAWKSAVVVGRAAPAPVTLAPGESRALRATVKIPNAKLWTPETPHLYVIDTATGGDSLSTRFGMREFRFDTATKRAYLNGKLYFLRGSNVTLHRFFEDPLSKQHPWEEAWVRKLLIDYSKRMNWNSYRFCIGPVPDKWFDIADESGLLVQNEFFIWNGRQRFPPYRAEELLAQYREWMRDNWNHPSVAIWDANNETDAPLLRDAVIPAMRKLDLSDRPWENGYTVPSGADDPVEDHPYLFSRIYGGQDFQMTELERMTGAKTTNAGHPSGHAVIANEYGWLWLLRDGTPAFLTERVWQKVLGAENTAPRRFEEYAYLLAGLTEFWRAHRNFAGVLHFTSLTCSYPGVKTGDHWRNVETLEPEPHFADYVRESFKPLGVYINFWQPRLAPGAARSYAVMMVNDFDHPVAGRLALSFERDGTAATRAEVPFALPAHGAHTWQVQLAAPPNPGQYLLRAMATPEQGEPTISRRKVDLR